MAINIFRMMEITGRSLSVQRTRMEVVSSNLANAQTTRTPEGGPYRRRDVVLTADRPRDDFGMLLDNEMDSVRTVRVVDIRPDESEPRLVYDPDHPDANEEGYVAYPNVDAMEEMVNLITVMRTYEANLSALTAVRDMTQSALRIGGN
jgi:flagellar basal-body rod protein FlgC